jgi:hypothetical protein
MNTETCILMAIPGILGAIAVAAVVRDWLRRRRARREIDRALEQRWTVGGWRTNWTAADEEKWQRLGRKGLLGNGWEAR